MTHEPASGRDSQVSAPQRRSPWRARAGWGLFLLVVIGYYWFFYTTGRFSSWPDWGNFYDTQAEGFRAGHLYTTVQPNPRLLLLPNPYDYANQQLWVWDYSLYRGHLYLYWGLTPAALLALVKGLLGLRAPVGDSWLVLTFLCVRLLAGSLLLRELARRFTPAPPRWALWSALLLFALAHPTPFLLARPAIYEAALTGGAAFLVCAYYFAFRWLSEAAAGERLGWLALGSTCLGLAGTTRTSLLPACALFALLLSARALAQLWPQLRRSPVRGWPWAALLRGGAAALLPFTALTVAHLLVNHLRFGSWKEFGVRYQLGIPFDMGPRFLPANLFNYLFHPWHTSCRFPFLWPRWHETVPLQYHLPSWLSIPEGYYAHEPLTGLLNAVPFCWLLLLLPLGLLWARWRRRTLPASAERRSAWRWFKALVSTVSVVSAVPVLLLFAFSMRYEVDFVSGLLLLSCLAGWRWLSLPQSSGGRRVVGIIYGGLAVLSIVLAAPLGFMGYYGSFQSHNLPLFVSLQEKLSTCPASQGGCATVRGCGP